MRILFDHGTPRPLRRALVLHDVTTAYALGWHNLQNGALLAQAEAIGFDAFVTTDQNIHYQQNIAGRTLAVMELMTNRWRLIRPHVDAISKEVDRLTPGTYVELSIPTP